jgi:hypothetical protein
MPTEISRERSRSPISHYEEQSEEEAVEAALELRMQKKQVNDTTGYRLWPICPILPSR